MAITSGLIENTAAALIHAERDLYPTLRTRISPHECVKIFRGFWLPREFLESFSYLWQRQEAVNIARILTSQRLLNGGVFARTSAALIHGAGILHSNPDVHIQIPYEGSRRRIRMPPVRLSPQRIAPAVSIYRHTGTPISTEVWDLAGLPITSRRATAADAARFMFSREAIAVGSALLRQETQFRRGDYASLERAQNVAQEMLSLLESATIQHRRKRAKQLLEMMNPACESPAEGSFLWALHAFSSAQWESQHQIEATPTDDALARSQQRFYYLDFAQMAARIAIEIEGQSKLGPTEIEQNVRTQDLLLRNTEVSGQGWQIIYVPATLALGKAQDLRQFLSEQAPHLFPRTRIIPAVLQDSWR